MHTYPHNSKQIPKHPGHDLLILFVLISTFFLSLCKFKTLQSIQNLHIKKDKTLQSIQNLHIKKDFGESIQ